MPIEVKVPTLPESIADATISAWHKKAGDTVTRGENLVDLETDKVVLEVPAPDDGTVKQILHDEGTTVTTDEVIALITAGENKASQSQQDDPQPSAEQSVAAQNSPNTNLSPAVRKLIAEHELDTDKIQGTGKAGRILKEDVLNHIAQQSAPATVSNETATPIMVNPQVTDATTTSNHRVEKRVQMTRLRARIAERLLDAQTNAAILSTFNEVNMQPVMDLRTRYKESFQAQHNVKLGFMSFFVKAAAEALKRFPAVNASIDGDDIVYHGYMDIGVAVSSPRGLVVPILRNAEHMSMATIEKNHCCIRPKSKRWITGNRRYDRRNLYHLQWRCIWFPIIHPNTKSTTKRDFGNA